ncbi:NlpC/P60 family protein [Candidatus Avoscillospira sp. LCP25S3_F1]|uniref:C40 family peptidase n=1 Tax=Candidatus Avoscillospira sp. LCP25S3_F1 TaxID=3438825 RepID=UPI003F8D9803
MKEIRTRPKGRDIQTRQTTAFLPEQAAKVLRENAARRQLTAKNTEQQEEAQSVFSEPASRFETTAQRAAEISARTAFRSGKALAQKQFDRAVISTKPKERVENAAPLRQSDPPQVMRAKQQFRQEQAKKQTERRRETVVREAKQEAFRVQDDFALQEHRFTDTPSSVPVDTPSVHTHRRRETASTPPQKAEKPPRELMFTGRQTQSMRQQAAAKVQAQVAAKTKEKMQQQFVQETAQKTAQTAKRTAKGFAWLKNAVIRTGQAAARAAVGLLGGAGALIALILVIGGAAAVMGTPFGVFWSGNDSDAQSVPQAVARINSEFASEISRIQVENPTDSVVIHREPDGGSDLTIRNWTDIIAVFAVKTAGADADATDVVTIDEERIDLIRQVFRDMNEVSWYVQTIEHEDDTETILHITITSKKATEMPDIYHFSKSQREALTEVLKPEYAQMLAELVGTYGGEVSLDEAQIRAMLAAMPKDVSAQRKAVVEKAYSLLGKVNYFWGGKSSAIGWDSRWGTPTRVTAPGSRSTGTVRPYGLDCSGFVDWVFNNSLGYVMGHGGGAASQHGYCKPISWSEALPGDLVFYPGDSHVGIFVGKDESGSPLIIHCASSQNNVVLTGLQGFTSIGRPDCFS